MKTRTATKMNTATTTTTTIPSTLEYLLTIPRGRGTELQTWQFLQGQLPNSCMHGIFRDDKGAFMGAWVETGRNPTIFTCHLDTIEHPDAGVKTLKIDQSAVITAHDPLTDRQMVLGADDGAGIYVMMRMIEENVSGLYLFFAGEESGGIGSKHLANCGRLKGIFDLRDYRRAIAFDRRGRTDVIDQQQGTPCCSKDFAKALASALTHPLYTYAPAVGIYTDTAELTHIVSECTNISVGYFDEHTARESLDYFYLEALIDTCINLDWEAPPTLREPKKDQYDLMAGMPSPTDIEIDDLIDHMLVTGITITDLLEYAKAFGLTGLI